MQFPYSSNSFHRSQEEEQDHSHYPKAGEHTKDDVILCFSWERNGEGGRGTGGGERNSEGRERNGEEQGEERGGEGEEQGKEKGEEEEERGGEGGQ